MARHFPKFISHLKEQHLKQEKEPVSLIETAVENEELKWVSKGKKTYESKKCEIEKEVENIPYEYPSLSAFVDNLGKLFIPTPLANTYTVYPNIDTYNQRSCYPDFISRDKVDISTMKQVPIIPGKLIISSV